MSIRFWAVDGSKITCISCGCAHEVECKEILDLSSGERIEVVLLVAVDLAREKRRLGERKLTENSERIELRDMVEARLNWALGCKLLGQKGLKTQKRLI